MAEPKCPSCNVVGIEHIVSTESKTTSQAGDPWFEVAHCDECGYVYSVFPKIVLAQSR
jgi:uncharacterized Zn finger protein